MHDLVIAGDIAELSELQHLEAADGRQLFYLPSSGLSSRIHPGSCAG